MNLSQDFPQQFEGWLHAIRELLTAMVAMMDIYLEENSEVITQPNKDFLTDFHEQAQQTISTIRQITRNNFGHPSQKQFFTEAEYIAILTQLDVAIDPIIHGTAYAPFVLDLIPCGQLTDGLRKVFSIWYWQMSDHREQLQELVGILSKA